MKTKFLFIAALAFLMIAAACDHTSRPAIIAKAIFDSRNQEVITSFSNEKEGTASILYGNSLAVQSAVQETDHHFSGEIFILVTWYQQPNPYWYGSNINSEIKTIEEVTITKGGSTTTVNYRFLKADQQIVRSFNLKKQERIDFILAQKASVFPSLAEHKL